jgi:DNA replication protein DnaC
MKKRPIEHGKRPLTYEYYLAEVMEREREVRRHNRIQRLLRESKLPLEKNLEAFEMSRLSSMPAAQVKALLEGFFVERSENVLAFGNPGSGKTHLLCAIGQELILQGRRVLFTPCSLLVQQLLIAKRDLKLPRALKRLSKYDALIIEGGILISEFGYGRPVWIYDMSREGIGHDQRKSKELKVPPTHNNEEV